MYVYIYIYLYVYIYIYIYLYLSLSIYIYIYIHRYLLSKWSHGRRSTARVLIFFQTLGLCMSCSLSTLSGWDMCVCIYIYIYIHIYVYVHIYIYIYIYIYNIFHSYISWYRWWICYGLTHNSMYLDMGLETLSYIIACCALSYHILIYIILCANWKYENWP